MNQLKPEIIAIIEQMTRESYSVRAIERMTGCHTDTISKYQRVSGLDKIDCACGRNIRHRGFCSVRFNRSVSRQNWMKGWHTSQDELAAAFSRLDDEIYFGASS